MIAGVADVLAARLRASVTFVRSLWLIAVLLYPTSTLIAYVALALLMPAAGRRVPGWINVVAVARIGLALVLSFGITRGLSLDRTGLFGQGPSVWVAAGGAVLSGWLALFSGGWARGALDERQARRIVLSLAPAALLVVTIAIGMLVTPGFRWELILELGVVGLGTGIAAGGPRFATAAAAVPAVLLALVAILLAASGARLQGGVGTVVAIPREPGSVPAAYRLAFGAETVDLRRLRRNGSAVTDVHASVGIGNLTIALPDSVQGAVMVRVGMGTLDSEAGAGRYGFDLRQAIRLPAADHGRPVAPAARLHLRVTAEVGRGCVTIITGYGKSFSDTNCSL